MDLLGLKYVGEIGFRIEGERETSLLLSTWALIAELARVIILDRDSALWFLEECPI